MADDSDEETVSLEDFYFSISVDAMQKPSSANPVCQMYDVVTEVDGITNALEP